MKPTSDQIAAAVETLRRAGWRIEPSDGRRTRFLTTGEIQIRYGTSDSWVRKKIRAGAWPNAWRCPSGSWRIPESDLVRWEENNR